MYSVLSSFFIFIYFIIISNNEMVNYLLKSIILYNYLYKLKLYTMVYKNVINNTLIEAPVKKAKSTFLYFFTLLTYILLYI